MPDEGRQSAEEGYDEQHGDDGQLLRSDEEREAALSSSPGPPPDDGADLLQELKDLNRRIHEDDGKPELYALDQPAPLLGVVAAVEAVDTTTPEGVIKAAATLAHGVAQAQSFRDGNRRTAFFATQALLERGGLPRISAGNDEKLVRLLNQVVKRQSSFMGLRQPPPASTFERLFLDRLKRHTEGRSG
jgi:hypothetical protein